MKKISKFIIALFISLNMVAFSFSAGTPVFDVSNLLTAIDQLYSSYDMVMNTLKQIEQGYQQFQFYLEQAKSWDLENISWDGDLDFRDEIKSVTNRVNKQITNIRKIEEIFTTKQYSAGGMTFTVADLVGAGDRDRDLLDVMRNVGNEMKNSWDQAAEALVNELSEDQKRAIWQKYGISPINFTYMQQKKQILQNVADQFIAYATAESETLEAQAEADVAVADAVVQEATNGGEHTEKELMQQNLVLSRELIKNISDLKLAVRQAAGQTALQQALTDEKEMQEQQAAAALMMETVDREMRDSMF
ncbi:MAG: hypothetical protein IAA16_04740 [Candidatus Treponema excrementipullorum]|uniref:P-type conjugative transfer protein TrbJ n=1 Tax=Candidatus Treponema excrementipullorum TaxID=2838768 RepID=A0A9E2L321_9SPIR|nr:hypothetical protein [Candidatus Treponema excrementipullorum]